jgi:hypothetical protein
VTTLWIINKEEDSILELARGREQGKIPGLFTVFTVSAQLIYQQYNVNELERSGISSSSRDVTGCEGRGTMLCLDEEPT